MIRELGVSDLRLVGWYAAWPGVPGAIAMVWWGRRSDALNERRWHGLAGMGLAMAGLLAYVAASSSLWLALLSVSLISCGLICALPVFWALVTSRLDPVISAAAIALINSLANLAGAFSPSITGALKARSGNLHGGALVCVAVLLVGAGVYAWAARPRPEATS
jgi:predicted MFS family arabinose efflux permease